MFKRLAIFVFLILICQQYLHASEYKIAKDYKIKIFYENYIIEKKPIIFQGILKGKATVIAEKTEDNKIKFMTLIVDLKTIQEKGAVLAFVKSYFFNLENAIFRNKQTDNIYLSNKKKSNVLVVRDFNKFDEYINDPKDEVTEIKAPFKYLKSKHSLEYPSNVLKSDHLYLKGTGDFVWISHMFNYETLNDQIFFNNGSSVFNPTQINKNLLYKSYFDAWTALALRRHHDFQNNLSTKDKYKIDLDLNLFDPNKNIDEYYYDFLNFNFNSKKEKENIKKAKAEEERKKKEKLEAEKKAKAEEERKKKEKLEAEKKAKAEETEIKNENNLSKGNTGNDVSNTIEKIKEINEMYKSGIITKEEFELLKNKLLN